MGIFLTDTQEVLIKGLPCELRVTISGEGEEGDISASVWLNNTDTILSTDILFRAMYIPDGSLSDDIDKQAALASAEALLDIDKLRRDAGIKLNKLSAVFVNYFGLHRLRLHRLKKNKTVS